MPVYLFTTPEGGRLVSAPSKKAAYDHIIPGMVTCKSASPNEIADAIREGHTLEFAQAPAVKEDVGLTDIEDYLAPVADTVEAALSQEAA